MVSTFGSLNTVVTGLQAQQLSLNTVGHNISNASTNGYSRQRVNLVASNAQTIYTNGGAVQLGMGVTSQSITRIRDAFIDRQYWKQNSILGTNQTLKTYLTKIEDVFGEPTETGKETILNQFWKSLESLSTDASNHSTRAVVIQNGVSLCTTIQQEAKQLKDMVSDINVIIGLRVDSINEITKEILSLNREISGIEANKTDHANDLRDRRDYLVDQLSYMIDLQVTEDDNGAFLIYSGGMSLVTASTRQELTTKPRKDEDYGYEVIDIINARTGDEMTFKNGELAALMNVRDSEDSGVKKYLNDLSNMAKFLLQEFNDVHKAGVDLNGEAGGNFFGVPGEEYNDPAHSTPPPPAVNPDYFKKGDWISHLQVSDKLTDPSTGTYKVAARTLLGETTQSNPQSGHAIISYDTNVTAADAMEEFKNFIQPAAPDDPANPGNPPPDFDRWELQRVEITAKITDNDDTALEPEGKVTEMDFSYTYYLVAVDVNGKQILDGNGDPYIDTSITGLGTCDQLPDPDTGSIIFQLKDSVTGVHDPAVGNLTIQVARSTGNTRDSIYSFSISSSSQMQGAAAGDNLINLCNRLKTDISKTLSNSSLDTYYSTQMGILGAQAQNAERMSDNQEAITNQLTAARESVSGVNQEEELTNMIRFQKAYNSAARIITAMDEMLEKLINGTGRVGA